MLGAMLSRLGTLGQFFQSSAARTSIFAGSALLASCSGPGFSVPVRDVVINASDSGGAICYVQGGEASPIRFASATYSATGTYEDNNPLTDRVVVRIYGRTEPPSQSCVPYGEGVDIPLSDSIELPEDEPTAVQVGGATYGSDLAEIIHNDEYWLGARISENFSLVSGEEIRLENGRISVAIW
jgi:hypothetical protein